MMKGLPLSYNRDMQLDKVPLFDSIKRISQMLSVMEKVLYGIKVNEQRIRESSHNESIFAADISEHLVTLGYPTILAHKIAGQLLLHSLKTKMPIKSMPNEELKRIAPELNATDVDRLVDPLQSVKRVKSYGGTNPNSVRKQIINWAKRLNARI
jgi:argininosuccinate lyase